MKFEQKMKQRQQQEAKRQPSLNPISETEMENELSSNNPTEQQVETSYVLPMSFQGKVSVLEQEMSQYSEYLEESKVEGYALSSKTISQAYQSENKAELMEKAKRMAKK